MLLILVFASEFITHYLKVLNHLYLKMFDEHAKSFHRLILWLEHLNQWANYLGSLCECALVTSGKT